MYQLYRSLRSKYWWWWFIKKSHLRARLADLRLWVHYNRPVCCAVCKKWTRANKSKVVSHRVRGRVRLCDACHEDLYFNPDLK